MYLSHAELPQPIRFKTIEKNKDVSILQEFIDRYQGMATKFTVDDDNVGRGLVCAFVANGKIQGTMVYLNKKEIERRLMESGYVVNQLNSVAHCYKLQSKL